MPYQIQAQLVVQYVGPGTGPLQVPSQQAIILGQLGLLGIGLATGNNSLAVVAVPGGESPTQSNFNTALSTMQTNMQNAIANNLTQIQGFATGGG